MMLEAWVLVERVETYGKFVEDEVLVELPAEPGDLRFKR
jgi:hypothetical protein